jgi:hypothetical protein
MVNPMRKRLISIFILVALCISLTGAAFAQSYYFQVPQLTIDVFWNEDGTLSADYTFVFINDASGPIEYVDLGLPNNNFDESSITASADGNPINYISSSEFEGEGSAGVAIGLGNYSIPTGKTGTVQIQVGKVEKVIYPDTSDSNYVSAVFKNPYFISSVVHGTTDLSVTFHLPPGVQPEEPRWHPSPAGFPSEPQTGIDDQGRVFYTWSDSTASMDTQYEFGASFPKQYVPASAVVRFNPFAWVSRIGTDWLLPCGCFSFFIFIIVWSIYSGNKRKLQYLPPKVSIEGHGIKRGLTAVEAAILLEQPLDKVLTMILFGVVKKNAAEVVSRDPLELTIKEPLPEDLYDYEKDFINAFKEKDKKARQRELSDATIGLVKSVSEKMKGFSRAETIAYYRDITKRAWEQVEAADTPEVKSQKFDEVMEWTMLDRNYDDRTKDVFRQQPVFIPVWWGRFDPAYSTSVKPSISGGGPSGKISSGSPSLPHLPGSDFAASMVKGVQSFSAGVVGNISEFTSSVTNKTNPAPKPTSSGGSYRSGGGGRSGGCACACACACAGCACACAGGGR